MNMLQSFKLALKSIRSNKMRSFLTMLGIIIGVASVIILVSLVNAYMSYMTESFASLGTNQINVNVMNLSSRSVSPEEMYGFYEEQEELFDNMTPVVNVSTVVKHGSDSMSSTGVTGVSEEYLDIKGYDLAISSIRTSCPDRKCVWPVTMWPGNCTAARRRPSIRP